MILVNAERARNPGEGSARGRPEPPPSDTRTPPPPRPATLYLLKIFISVSPASPLPLQLRAAEQDSTLTWRCADARGGAGGGEWGRLPRASTGPGPTTSGPAGRALRVEGRADGPAPSLPPIMPPSAASSGGGERGGVAGRGRGLQGGEDPKTAGEGVAGREEFSSPQRVLSDASGACCEDTPRLPACVRLELNFPGKAPSARGRRGKVLAAPPPLLPVLYFFCGGGGRFAT